MEHAADVEQTDPAGFEHCLTIYTAWESHPLRACSAFRPSCESGAMARGNRLSSRTPQDWRPQLAYLVSRHASQLDRWQLGADGTDAFVTDPKMRQLYALFYRELSICCSVPIWRCPGRPGTS